jgi:hypothetical protein
MADTRKLIAILAALLQGGSAYASAKQDEEDRKRRQAREEQADAERADNSRLQRDWYERAVSQDELRLAEQKRAEVNAANERLVERGGRVASDRAYGSVADKPLPRLRPAPGSRSAAEFGAGYRGPALNVDPNVAGDGKVDLDLTRILAGVREGGDLDRAGAVGEVSTRAREDASSRAARSSQGIDAKRAERDAFREEDFADWRRQFDYTQAHTPRGGAGGPAEGVQYSRLEEAAQGRAAELAAQGKGDTAIAQDLQRDPQFESIHQATLAGFAVDADRNQRKAKQGGYAGGPEPTMGFGNQGPQSLYGTSRFDEIMGGGR